MEKAFGILVSRFKVLVSTMEQRPKFVRNIVFTCVVLHNMMRTHQGITDGAPIQGNYVAAIQNDRVYVPKKELQESFGDAKHKQELLEDNFKPSLTHSLTHSLAEVVLLLLFDVN